MAKLLLADDSITIQRVIEMTFAGEDITVVPVSDGEQAIVRIGEERPDIVLADIAMPKRSGYDVSAFVKSRPELAHIPVLLLAGAFEPVDQARAEQVKCDGVLVKPFEPQQVIARVRELLGGVRGAASQTTPGVPRPVERLTSLKLVEPRREKPVTPPPGTAATAPSSAAQQPARPAVPTRPQQPTPSVPAPPTPPQAGSPPAARQALGERDGDAPAAGLDDALDDYFDRLDEAFANLASSPATQANPAAPTWTSQTSRIATPAARAVEAPDDSAAVPTIDSLLGLGGTKSSLPTPASPVIEPPDSSPTLASQPAPPVAMPSPAPVPVPVRDTPAASANLSSRTAESRDAIADAFSALLAAELGEPGAAPVRLKPSAGEPQISEALVEEVTRRVVQRLAPDVVRQVVVDVVADLAERLIREEIARIRQK